MLFTAILPVAAVVTINTNETIAISIGDYIIFGTYYGEPILWRCVDIENGKPLMLTDRIITIRPFDAGGSHPNDNEWNRRYNNGSNLWETSNMRSRLNSTAPAGEVVWLCENPPTADRVWNGYNAYAHESGFLSNDNFTASERSAIWQVSQRSHLSYADRDMAIYGNTIHSWNINAGNEIAIFVSNFYNAFAHYVTDRMFLLDVPQVNRVWQNSEMLGDNYHRTRPTQSAVNNSEWQGVWGWDRLGVEYNWWYWLRTPNSSGLAITSDESLWVGIRNTVLVQRGYHGRAGVRPAFVLNLDSAVFISGNGTYENPFVVDGNGNGNWSDGDELPISKRPKNLNIEEVTLANIHTATSISIPMPDTNLSAVRPMIAFLDGAMVASDVNMDYSIANNVLTIDMTSVEVPQDLTEVRIFIWDNLQNMRPIMDVIEIN